MVVDERSRHELFRRLEQTLGEEAAATLMEHLPPVGWADVATRRDIDSLRADLRAGLADVRTEMADLRTDLRTEMADLRTDTADLRTDLRTEMADLRTDTADLRTDLRTEMADVRAEVSGVRADFRGEIAAALTSQTRVIMFSMLGAIIAHGGLVLAVVRIGP